MPQNQRKVGPFHILLLVSAASALLTTTICILLTDPAISDSLWPRDIHERVISHLGGEVSQEVAGNSRSHLNWTFVFVRVVTALAVLCGVSAALHCWPARDRHFAETDDRGVMSGRGTGPRWINLFQRSLQKTGTNSVWCLLWLALWTASSLLPGSWLEQFVWLTPTFWAALLGAGLLSGLWSGDFPPACGSPSRMPLVSLLAVTCGWIAISFWLNERLYAGLRIPHGDSAMYEEHLWNVWHGKGFRSYLDQGLFLGEHIQVIHLLLLPLHMLWPSHLLLELAESVALGICVVPIWRITLRHSGSRAAAAWLSAAWLFFYPMHFLDIAIDLKTLRPSCYGLPFLLWGIDLAERYRWKSAGLCLVVALSAQEDFALIVGPVALVLWWYQRQEGRTDPAAAVSARWALATGCLTFVYLLAAVLIIIPAFRGGMAVHYSRYFGDLGNSPGDLARTVLQDPLRVISRILSLRTLTYLLVFSVPLGFLNFRSPLRLMAASLTFLMLSLIQLGDVAPAESRPTAGSTPGAPQPVKAELPPVPYHHFHAPLLPVLFWAAAAGLGNHRRSDRTRFGGLLPQWPLSDRFSAASAARFACCCSVLTSVTGSLMPCGAAFWSERAATGYRQRFVPGHRSEHFPKVLAQLPVTSRVASTDYVHTRLTHYERSYDYSDYLRAVNNYLPGVPDDTDYIVIDTQHPYSAIRSPRDVRELRESPERWELLPDQTDGYFIILKRRPERRPD